MIRLITDSTCDLTPETLSERGILSVPLTVLFGAEAYRDKIDLSTEGFYEKMRAERALPTTSQVNPGAFYEQFERCVDAGETVICVCLSSELSGTYASAVIAKDMLGDAGQAVHLVDSRIVAFGLGLMVLKLQDAIDRGDALESILERAAHFSRDIRILGLLDTLENLKKGGRLSGGAAALGRFLGVKPIISVENGRVGMTDKVRGRKRGFRWMLERLKQQYPDGIIDEMAIAYAYDREAMLQLKMHLNDAFVIETLHEIEIGSVVGTHTGEGAVGIAFLEKAL